MFEIDHRLQSDSHELCLHQGCHIRLHNNASLPWIILVPEVEVIEFCDLDPSWQLKITDISRQISTHMKSHLHCEKINFAAIGNVVQQLHIHVVGRHRKDPVWPDVVWGQSLPDVTYSDADRQQWQQTLKHLLENRS